MAETIGATTTGAWIHQALDSTSFDKEAQSFTSTHGDRLWGEVRKAIYEGSDNPLGVFCAYMREGFSLSVTETKELNREVAAEWASGDSAGGLLSLRLDITPQQLLLTDHAEREGHGIQIIVPVLSPSRRHFRNVLSYQLVEWPAGKEVDRRATQFFNSIPGRHPQQVKQHFLISESDSPVCAEDDCLLDHVHPADDPRVQRSEELFVQLIHVLWVRLLAFSPDQTMTSTFADRRKLVGEQQRSLFKILYMNELRIINQGSTFVWQVKHLQSKELHLESIRNLLRGHATWRALELALGHRITVRSWLLKKVGTFGWPTNYLHPLALLVRDTSNGKISRHQFCKALSALKEAARKGAPVTLADLDFVMSKGST